MGILLLASLEPPKTGTVKKDAPILLLFGPLQTSTNAMVSTMVSKECEMDFVHPQ